ncbi:uncharacterized protein LOC143184580 [Calliopsis andreniformis]|uniref:uncharacterized protein LOC143184580 n=1 Tax=Calliopsis andreniformis TaxID=337506 RepID=UPI003FCCD30D
MSQHPSRRLILRARKKGCTIHLLCILDHSGVGSEKSQQGRREEVGKAGVGAIAVHPASRLGRPIQRQIPRKIGWRSGGLKITVPTQTVTWIARGAPFMKVARGSLTAVASAAVTVAETTLMGGKVLRVHPC